MVLAELALVQESGRVLEQGWELVLGTWRVTTMVVLMGKWTQMAS